ncbi:hypothetical protein AB834_06720 [PVC group bacterium (ex Bugula neritina AB1)]|nr:hypothetical protein AB834_06720 [PVC group bacterium (ex Bugula neritina AB1)]
MRPFKFDIEKKVDKFFSARSRKDLLRMIALLLILLFFIKGIFLFFQQYLQEKVSFKIVKEIRDDAYEHLHSLSLDYFQKKHIGQLISKLTMDAQRIHEALVHGVAAIALDLLNVVMYIGITFYLNWRLAILTLIFLPILIAPIIRISSRIRKITAKSQEKLGNVTSLLQEGLMGVKEVKISCNEEREVQRFQEETAIFYKMAMKCVRRSSLLSPLMEVTVALSLAFFLIVGGRQVLSGEITPGQFLLFTVAAISLFRPLKKLGKSYSLLQESLASADRVFDLFKQESTIKEVENPRALDSFKEEILFQKVGIAYVPDKYILKNISFSVKKGTVVAIVGSTGVGKTSLLNLIPRFYDPQEGNVFVDKVNVKDYSLKDLRSSVGMVSQDMTLFHNTILYNITYGAEKVDVERAKEVARLANADIFIKEMKDGYNTYVGERGVLLSGGERQRIAIARALYQDPDILILDEATSALDVETEKLVQEAIDHLLVGRTVLIVAHRLATVQAADCILVLSEGKIVEQGTHQELLKKGGKYKFFYEMQFSS